MFLMHCKDDCPGQVTEEEEEFDEFEELDEDAIEFHTGIWDFWA